MASVYNVLQNSSLAPGATDVPLIQLDIERNACAYFYYSNIALIFWVVASVLCFLALLSTIYTIWYAYQLWSVIQDLENSIIDLLDEACLILLPLGVCKQICHPHHIGNVNANYLPKQEQKEGKKDNRYPEDVTFPPSDIEKVYDLMGDEDARRSKTISLVPTIQLEAELQTPLPHTPAAEIVSKTPHTREMQLQRTPVASREVGSDKKKPSRERTTPSSEMKRPTSRETTTSETKKVSSIQKALSQFKTMSTEATKTVKEPTPKKSTKEKKVGSMSAKKKPTVETTQQTKTVSKELAE